MSFVLHVKCPTLFEVNSLSDIKRMAPEKIFMKNSISNHVVSERFSEKA